MKNFNLIEWLWKTDSHEKQSPQRFARYAAMLIMLLTLSVGQMWGDITYSGGYIYFDNSLGINSTTLQICARQSSWTGVSSLSNISNTKLYYVADPQGSGWGGILGWVVISANPAKSNSNFDNWSSYTWCSDWNTYGFNSGSTYLIVPSSTSKSQSVTTTYYSGGYSALNSTQTIKSAVKTGSGSYTTANSKATISITSYKLTGNGTVTQQSTSLSTSASSQTVSAARTATTTLSVGDVASGYQFDGWYTAETGGTQLSTSTSYTYYPTAATTVYARFSEKMSTVTLTASPAAKGSFTIGGAAATSTTAGVTTTRSVTAVPISGYHFVSWAITGGASISSTSTNPTTVTGGGAGTAATLTATFAADDVYTLTVAAGTGISSVTGTTNNIKAGDNIAITATVASGYTWSTWTKTGAGTLSTYTAGTKNQTVTVGTAGDITLTASATETMRTITISGGHVYGGAATSTTAGVATSAKITANDPAAGKKFTGWSLGAGVSLKGGYALTDQTIEIYSTANATVTANYADRAQVKMYFAKPTSLSWGTLYAYAWQNSNTSNNNKAYPGVELSTTEVINCVTYYVYQYYTEGDGIGGAATGNSAWDRIIFGCNSDDKKTGDLTISNGHYYYKTSSGTGKAAAITSAWGVKTSKDSFSGTNYITHNCATNSGSVDISFTGGNNYTFKVYNEVNDQWWSNSTAIGSSNPVTASMASTKTLYNNDANNMQVNAALTGSYTFTVGSTNASNPTIKVTFPEIYAIVGSFNSWNTETNPLSMVGNTGTVNIVLAPSGSNYTLKVVDDGSMYGKNSTTITGTTTVSSMSTSGANINLTADIYPASANPSYSFSYNKSTKALTVTYPAAHTVTYGVGTHAGTASVTSSISVASGKKILDSQSITFSKGDTKTGYTWKGWYNNTSGSSSALGTGATYTSSSRAANISVYACYNLVNYTITYNLNGGSNPVSPAPATSFTIESAAITLPTPTKTGYTFAGWYENADLSTGGVKTTIPAGSTGNKVYYAKWTPITYTIHFNGNGNTSGSMSNQTGVTYDAATTITANAFVKTGYNFGGWATTQERANAGTVDRADGAAHGNLASTQGATAQLWAIWTPKQSAITFDYQTGVTGYSSSGDITNASGLKGTYDAAMTALTGTMPSADEGYAFMGFYDAVAGGGTKYYNADGTSAHAWDKDTESGTTLYAYWAKAEITNITFSPGAVVENNSTVTVTATISPTPAGTTSICWRVLYDNGSALDPQPTFTPEAGASVSFTAPNASGMYKVEAKLHTGSSCGGGTLLDTEVADFQVAGSHTVTVAYKHSGTDIAASTSVTGRPLDWSDPITAPDIFGYTFSNWTAVDGVTIKNGESDPVTTSTNATIQIKATYNGTLTANYTQKNIVYFKDNLEWTDPNDADAHIYVNLLTEDYWNASNGSGNKGKSNCNLAMDRVPGTADIFYYDYGSKPTSHFISFTKESMNNYESFYQGSAAHVVFPSRALDALSTNNDNGLGFYAATPMFVPLATQTPVDMNGGHAKYYNDGYWTKFTPGTGYTLEIYNNTGSIKLKTIEFTSADDLMPMKVVADLEGGQTYKFQLKRDGDVYYGNGGTMTYTDHGQNTAWDFYNNDPFKMCTIVTNAAGDYTFNLSYSPNKGGTNNRLRIAVDYPVASGDYRLVYTDNTRSGRIKPSAIVAKENDGTATVSFFVRKDQSPILRIQQATVALDGTITWKEYPTDGIPTNQITGSIASAITATGVWNFNLEMNGSGAMSVASAEAYKGNYYIRTDAANSKWDNYRTDPDHLMTYSDYLKSDVDYTHYYTHWVDKDETGRKNVKFVIANDYSPCISDTLIRETASGTWANIASFITTGGDLIRSANVRFMWDEETNNIARAYIDGAQGTGSDIFLRMLSSDSRIKQGETVKTSVAFQDNGNWIYEANVLAQPEAQIKLKSTWGSGTTIEQYFKGSESETESLVGGSGDDWYPIRVLYDFKTNRLVAAYLPTTGTISSDIEINADVMFIREHHGDIAQLTFSGSGAISDIKTAYGVLRLNKWTINNKSKSEGHAPLSPELSRFERDLFYISFPFRVNLEEVFGFGTYGTHWIIEEYDGAARAANGFWAETPTFWRFITNRKGKFLEPNQGYIVALDLDELGESSSVWANTDQVELYFPSYGSMPDIKSSNVTYNVPAHTCTINRATPDGDRRIKDSHWNVISVPTYINTSNVTFANTDWITAGDGKLGPSFLYTVNWNDNTLSATSGAGYTYKAMHAYIVQYKDNITWTTSVSPASIVAREHTAPTNVEFRIELQQNEQTIDQTFVRMSNDEEVSTGFAFGEDLSKEFNKNKANIYTMITSNIDGDLSITEAAGNVLPMSEQTTVVPVGVKIVANGDYTFSIPDGTEGTGVTLIDNETGVHTNLALMDYTVALEAGTYDGRFILEISPIAQTPTGVDTISDEGLEMQGARKVIIDEKMYILKDGKVYDARGARVQ